MKHKEPSPTVYLYESEHGHDWDTRLRARLKYAELMRQEAEAKAAWWNTELARLQEALCGDEASGPCPVSVEEMP